MRNPPSRVLWIIRIALITGVATFAGIVAWQRATNAVLARGVGAELPLEGLRIALWGLAVAAVLAAFWLRSRIANARDGGQSRSSMTIIGWSFGEGTALFGIVQHYLGAPVSTMIVGLLVFAAVLLMLPVPRTAT